MNPAAFWSFVLFIICIVGAKRIGKWEGPSGKKTFYRIFLLILGTVLTFFLALNIGFYPAYEKPLFYIFGITIILHLSLKRAGQIWITFGILPFSKEYPIKEKKDWKDMFYCERIFLVGILLASFSLDIPITENSINMILRFVLFGIGIFAIVTGLYLKYSNPKLFVGFLSLIFSIWLMPLNQSYELILFWIGVGFLVWAYLQIKKMRNATQIETNKLNE